MNSSKIFIPLFFVTSVFLPQPLAFGQENGSETELSQSTPFFISLDPFQVSVTWQKDNTLAVDPDWVAVVGDDAFKQMQIPPTIRASAQEGWLVGEFASKDGSWSPLFSVPVDESKANSDSEALEEDMVLSTPTQDTTIDSTADITTSANDDSTIDPLAVGVSDSAFPSKVSSEWLQSVVNRPLPPGARRFYVNNTSGDDTSEGKMIHPQSGKLSAKGPMRNLPAVLKQIHSGDEIVLVETGIAYKAKFLNPAVTEIIITPIGDVILEPSTN